VHRVQGFGKGHVGVPDCCANITWISVAEGGRERLEVVEEPSG